MAQLEYSTQALNVLSKFYGCKVLVYVEGDDDLLFWRAVFDDAASSEIVIEGLGGSSEVDKFIDRIEREGVELVVARDADYTLIGGARSESKKVLYSFGYSIENSLYTPKSIAKIAEVCHRRSGPTDSDVSSWLEQITEELRDLVVCDVASQLEGLGVSVIGANCDRFMQSAKSPRVSTSKVESRLGEVAGRIPKASRRRAEARISESGGYGPHMVRGHFLASAALRFIADYAKKNVSNETLYTNAISWFQHEIRGAHPHRNYYRAIVQEALSELGVPA